MLHKGSLRKVLMAFGCLALLLGCPVAGQAVLAPQPGQAAAGQLPGAGSLTLDDGFLLQTQALKSKLSPAQKKLGSDLLQLSAGELFQDWVTRDSQIQSMETLYMFMYILTRVMPLHWWIRLPWKSRTGMKPAALPWPGSRSKTWKPWPPRRVSGRSVRSCRRLPRSDPRQPKVTPYIARRMSVPPIVRAVPA